MKKKFNLIIKIALNILFYFILVTNSSANDQPGCELVAKRLKQIKYELLPQDLYDNFGFMLEEKFDRSKNEWNYILGLE